MILPHFIVLEGIDGAGTSTQLSLLKNTFGTQKFLFTAEPTTFETGSFLRKMLKADFCVTNETAAYLFAADRNEHINGTLRIQDNSQLITGVKEAVQTGYTVISDRYLFSSLAYQSINCKKEVPRTVNSLFPLPELLFYFDIAPSTALSRIQNRGTKEIYEKESFLEKTVSAYKAVLQEYKTLYTDMNIVILDATESTEALHKKICAHIEQICRK